MKVAITGDIASGKSTLTEHLKKLGWLVVQTDKLARAVMESREGQACLKELFGGRIPPFKELQARFIADEALRQAWEAFVHPRVRVAWQAALQTNRTANCVVELPLLFENKLEESFESIVVCTASASVAAARWQAKGRSRAVWEGLTKLLLPIEQKTSKAHHCIDNSGSLEDFYKRADALHCKLLNYNV